jgi:protocatechuate 3,4-dioxygenase beta subunit
MTHHDHDRGLRGDLEALTEHALRRRAVLKWGLGLGALPLAACAIETDPDGSSDGLNADSSEPDGGDPANTGTCSRIPEETEGPYPGDGTNGQNALTLSGIVRRDIRSSIAGATGVAGGIELTVTLTVLDGSNGCTPLAGHAVYLWHCDREGNYSMYSAAAAGENYLRGVQVTDEDGKVTFTTIFPGCYSGRWPHIHFEIYSSLDQASSGTNKIATSQLAFPEADCIDVYASEGYEQSVRNLSQITLETDGIFRDSVEFQLAATTGDVAGGYTAHLNVAI